MLNVEKDIIIEKPLGLKFEDTVRMMDAVALVERRILALLGEQMNRRYYMRR